MKKRNNYVAVILMLSFLLYIFSGCRNASYRQNSILIMGSTALQPLAEQAARMFMYDRPEANIQVQGGGSGNGLTAVSQGVVNIGNSDIFAEEKKGINSSELEDHKVAVAGFAVIVNPNAGIDNLTAQQLIDIFTGTIKNWKDAGGNDVPVVLISRPASSGTRAAFKKYALKGAEEATSGKALTQDSSGAVLQAVSSTDGAVSYIGLSYIKNNSSIKVLKIDGVEPNAQNISEGKYPIWSYEHMYTKGPAEGIVKDYIEYIMGDKVKPYIIKLGYIPVSDMKVRR